MAEKNNATCSICDKKYYKCVSCKGKASAEPYKMYCCSSDHYKVFQVIRGFNNGVYTKDEANDKLKNINLSDLSKFRSHIKKIVKEIMKVEKNVEPVVQEVADKSVIEIMDVAVDDTKATSYVNRGKKSFNLEDSE